MGSWRIILVVLSRHFLRLVHYWLPVMLGWSLALVMRRASGAPFSHAGLALLLAGIGAAYSFDRIVDAPPDDASPGWLRRVLWAMTGLCTGAMLLVAATGNIPINTLGAAAMLSVMSLAYTLLKRLPLVKTLAVAFAWTWACAVLPLASAEHHAWWWLSLDVTLPLILMLSAACILCDLKDTPRDREGRIPSLPVLLGVRPACALATALAVAALCLAAMHNRPGIAAASALLAVAAQFPKLLARESIGPIVVDSILVIPGVLILTGLV